jgi:alpha-L-fucosidase
MSHFSRRAALRALAGAPALLLAGKASAQEDYPIAKGHYNGTADSLKEFRIPEWFRDAKFGMWAHWGPQSGVEDGDWYARNMYIETQQQYKDHLQTYGHPSKVGYKDLCPLWKGAEFDPEHLISLYKKAGAKYFMSMGVHHDNFDLWNSKHQPRWNAVATGPKKDVVGLWRDAARKQGLKFAVSEHLSNSYNWLAVSHGADKSGQYAGVPYDGTDPAYADLYHPFPKDQPIPTQAMSRDVPDAWKHQYFLRIKDLIDNYHPDLLYTDGGIPFGEIGYRLLSHYYNTVPQGVYTSKTRKDCETGTCALDIERGVANTILPDPWQTDTCIGSWHYKRGQRYKTTKTVIDLLCDIVSRNGNLMLNIPLPNSGKPDDEELKVVEGITKWMAVNSEGIYGTRPWKISGNPPAAPAPGAQMGFNERNRKDLTAADVRYTTKGGTLYAFVMGWPEHQALIPTLATGQAGQIRSVELLGNRGKLKFTQTAEGLKIDLPPQQPSEHAVAFKIVGA